MRMELDEIERRGGNLWLHMPRYYRASVGNSGLCRGYVRGVLSAIMNINYAGLTLQMP